MNDESADKAKKMIEKMESESKSEAVEETDKE